MSTPMDKIEIQVTSDTSDAIKNLQELVSTLTNITDLTRGIRKESKEAAKSITDLSNSLAKVGKKATSAFSALAKSLEKLGGADFSKIKPPTQENAEAHPESDSNKNNGGEVTDAGASQVESAAEKATKALERLKAVLSTVGEKSRTAFKAIGEAIKSTTVKSSEFLRALMRIATYRAIRGIIASITDGFKQGIQNLYAFSKQAGTSFANSMDKMATSVNYFRNSMGTLSENLLNALAPALDAIIDKVVAVINVIAQMIAVFAGATNFSPAIKVSKAFADNMKSGAGSAKEILALISGFDELNKLNDPGGGGGGGASNIIDPTQFENIPVDPKIVYWATLIKEIFSVIKDHAWDIVAAIAAWKIGKAFELDLTKILGLVVAFASTAEFIKDMLDAWNNGVTFDNLKDMIVDLALVAGGLFLAFGTVGAGVGLLVGGVLLVITAIHDWIKTGELSKPTFTMLEAGFLAIGVAISLLTGSWIPLVISAIVALVGLIVYNWDSIKEWTSEKWNAIKEKVVSVATDIKEKVSTKFTEMKENVAQKFDNIKTTVASKIELIKNTITEKFNAAKEKGIEIINKLKDEMGKIIDKIKKLFDFKWELPKLKLPHIQVSYEPTSNTVAKFLGINSLPKLSVSWYANGGFPDTGEMFVAREAGPELVGSIGNRTAVANNDQIVEAVSRGVYDAMMSANSQNGGTVQATVNDRVLFEVMVNRARQETARTGKNPLLGGV